MAFAINSAGPIEKSTDRKADFQIVSYNRLVCPFVSLWSFSKNGHSA